MGKEQFSSNVVVANEYTLLGGSKSVFNTRSLNAGVVHGVYANATALINRTSVTVSSHPDNDLIYIGLDNTVSITKYGIVLQSGQTVQIKLSSTDPVNLHMISSSSGKVGIIEGAI